MGAIITQTFPPGPTFTENNVPSLEGKVFIVTGGNAGIGLELVKILYSRGGTVYIASRSPAKVAAEIKAIKSALAENPGQVKSLHLDLTDLATIKPCVSTFLAQESRLDVLWNNAGIAHVAPGSVSVQGQEAHMGTNCLGPFLLTKLLLPILIKTAKSSTEASVRVVFSSSGIVEINTPPGGVSLAELIPGSYSQDKARNYGASKAGNWLLASEFDKLVCKDGVVCLTQNPGNLKTKSWDNLFWLMRILFSPLRYEPKMGAYTLLWTGLSHDIKLEDGGRYAIPWGRWHPSPRKDILDSLKTKEEGGTGLAKDFWEWCEEQTKEFA